MVTQALDTPKLPIASGHLSREDSLALGRRRRGRNIALMLVLLAVAALFYAIAIVKLTRPDLGPP